MSIRTFLKPLSFIPALFMMYMIFSFSSQEADVSSSLSYQVSHLVVESADRVMDLDLTYEQTEHYTYRIEWLVRKAAHVGEYFLLAITVSFPLYVYGMHGLLLMIVAGVFCIAFAAGDEYHQTFVSGRAGQIRDIYIDSAGVLLGIIMVRIIGWTGRMTIFRPDPYVEEKKASAEDAQTRGKISGKRTQTHAGALQAGKAGEAGQTRQTGQA